MSEKTPQSKKTTRVGVLLTVAALFIILAGMREAQEILLPFLIAVFLAVVSSPAVFWMTGETRSPRPGGLARCRGHGRRRNRLGCPDRHFRQ